MSKASNLRCAVAAHLRSNPGLASDIEIFAGKERDIADDLDAALEAVGICIYVMPPLPRFHTEGAEFVFFEAADLRVRVIEVPLSNKSSMDAYDVVEEVARSLHWACMPELLQHPIQLVNPPVDIVEDPDNRVYDVLFTLTYQLN